MTSTPDSFSAEALQTALETAPKEQEATKTVWQLRTELHPDMPYNGMDEDELNEYVDKLIDQIYEEQPHVVFTKLLACRLVCYLAQHQESVSKALFDTGEAKPKQIAAWLKDSGRLWGCLEQLRRIEVHPNDYIAEEDARRAAGYHGLI